MEILPDLGACVLCGRTRTNRGLHKLGPLQKRVHTGRHTSKSGTEWKRFDLYERKQSKVGCMGVAELSVRFLSHDKHVQYLSQGKLIVDWIVEYILIRV